MDKRYSLPPPHYDTLHVTAFHTMTPCMLQPLHITTPCMLQPPTLRYPACYSLPHYGTLSATAPLPPGRSAPSPARPCSLPCCPTWPSAPVPCPAPHAWRRLAFAAATQGRQAAATADTGDTHVIQWLQAPADRFSLPLRTGCTKGYCYCHSLLVYYHYY